MLTQSDCPCLVICRQCCCGLLHLLKRSWFSLTSLICLFAFSKHFFLVTHTCNTHFLPTSVLVYFFISSTLSLYPVSPTHPHPQMPCALLVKRLLATSFSIVPLSMRTCKRYSCLESSPATVARPFVVVSINSGCGSSEHKTDKHT